MKHFGITLTAALGLAVGAISAAKGEDKVGPSFPTPPAPIAATAATPAEGGTIWQMTIAPKYGPALVADFYQETDGSLTVIHREASHAIAPQGEAIQQAPAPTPRPKENGATPLPKNEEPALKTPSAARNRGRVVFAVDEVVKQPEAEMPPPTLKSENEKPTTPAPRTAEEAIPGGIAPIGAQPWGIGGRPSYADVYFSIPFFRSEYAANPSYRHEATMEILFGQLRPTVVHKYVQPPVIYRNDYNYITPYSYNLNGRGVSYNFFYPRPSVYRRY